MGTLHEDQYTFLIISRLVLLEIRNVSGEVVQTDKIYTGRFIMFSVITNIYN